jgi:hypothetical protein
MSNEQIIKNARDQFAAKREDMLRKGMEKLLSDIADVKQLDDEFMNDIMIPAFSGAV